ncbi:MAG: hypothetical protein M3Q56_05280 [Bacteroidota bacterium]|nr:hypothetical protein [Bacteroidota bacterium]
MKIASITPQVLFLIILGVNLGCVKDELQKGEAFAFSSFKNSESKFDAKFVDGDRPNSISLRLTHYSDNGYLNIIQIANAPKTNDTTYLTHFDEIPSMPIDTFRAEFFVQLDEDVIGDYYVVDTVHSNADSYIILSDFSARKVTGSFQINFVLDPEITWIKFDESIPDTFNIRNGRFSAEQY